MGNMMDVKKVMMKINNNECDKEVDMMTRPHTLQHGSAHNEHDY